MASGDWLKNKIELFKDDFDFRLETFILDITEDQKTQRDAVRYILKKAQFVQLKSSIWISPFPLEHMMINMKEDLGLEDELMVIVTDKLDSGTEALLERRFTKKED